MKISRLSVGGLYSLALALALAVLPVRGDTVTNHYTGDVWTFEDAKKIQAAAAEITPAKYPDSDEATVEEKMERVYRPDGTGESQDESFVKVLTEKGKRGSRTLGLSYMLPYTTVDVVKVEVLKPDGQVVPVDVAANSKDSIDESGMSMNIYDPNSRVLQVNIPEIEIGDTLHAITRTTTERAYIPGAFAEENVFEGVGYVRHLSYEIHAPAERPLKCIELRDEVPGTVHYQAETNGEGAVTYRWDVADVPRMFEEPAMPPGEMILQRLLVSTLPDWPAVSKWYWELSKPHLDATTPDMEKTVARLTAGANTDLDKIKAVFYYVSKNVRYMGLTPEKDRPGFEPHDVKLTFGKNYGVCRDKAALLVEMLREAGLKAYPVLINVGTKRDALVPDPGFNHAIVGVELDKGQYTLMDPTDENTRDLLPTYDRDQSYLVCRPDGEGLLTSAVDPAEHHLIRVNTTGTLSAGGVLAAKTELSFEGENDDAYRNGFVKMKPDDIRRFFERDLKATIPGAKLTSLKLLPENMLDMTTNVRAELEYTATGLTATGKGDSMVTVPWIGSGVGVVNFILNANTGLDKRKYPLRTEVACGLEESVALTLDKGFAGAVSLPDCKPVEDESLSCRHEFTYTNNTLTCTREFKLKNVEFSPPQYLELKRTLKNMEFDGRKMPVLVMAKNAQPEPPAVPVTAGKTAVDSAAKILDVHKELDVTDAHTAVFRVSYVKQILSYNGKKREAEVKIDYNPACQEAKLIHGTVISKTGVRQEIAKDEINIMDAGWNASAKRYTGGKILVANLPDVEVGSTIEVEYAITSTNKAFLASVDSFQLVDELAHKTFDLTAPAKLKVQKLVTGADGVIKEHDQTAGGKQVFQWEAKTVPALPAETQLPPEWIFNAAVGYFIGDVNDYYKELNRIMLDRSQKSSKAAGVAHGLAATAKNHVELVKAIRDQIVKSIRLDGPVFTDLPLTELSDADTTLADGYGHLADRAILFHAMLTAAGFKPEFVLASELPPLKGITGVMKSFPLPQRFELPLVRVVVDGETYYLNDTDQYAQLGTTTHDGKLGIALATHNLETIHAAKGCENLTETHYSMTLGDDGRARIGVKYSLYGAEFNDQNRYFSELPPEERRRHFQELVSGVAQGARPVGDLVTTFDTYPGTEQFTVEIDNYAVVDGKYFYFDLPFTPSLFPSEADRRVLPLFIGQGNKTSVRTEIDLPPGFRQLTIAPKDERLETPGSVAQTTLVHDGDQCVITHELETKPAIISPKDYPAMLKTESSLSQKSSRVFLLEKTDQPQAAVAPTKG